MPFLLDQFPNSRTVVGLGVAPRSVAYAGGKLSAAAVAQSLPQARAAIQTMNAAAPSNGLDGFVSALAAVYEVVPTSFELAYPLDNSSASVAFVAASVPLPPPAVTAASLVGVSPQLTCRQRPALPPSEASK